MMLSEFDPGVFRDSLPFLRSGLLFSLDLTLIALSGGIVAGTLLALARLSAVRPLAAVAAFYVDVMRSIPLLMVILWFFLIIPLLTGRAIGAENSAIVTFTAFEAAYFGEIIRAGIQSIPRGQVAAGRALGMSSRQVNRLVVLPQAFRNMLPVLLTQTIILFQDTSLVYVIGAKDLLKAAELAGRNYNRPIEMYVLAAGLYLVLCLTLSALVRWLGRRTTIVR